MERERERNYIVVAAATGDVAAYSATAAGAAGVYMYARIKRE